MIIEPTPRPTTDRRPPAVRTLAVSGLVWAVIATTGGCTSSRAAEWDGRLSVQSRDTRVPIDVQRFGGAADGSIRLVSERDTD